MLQSLIRSVCNTTEGFVDAYDVVLTSLAKHADLDTQNQVELVVMDVALALQERPALRRTMALLCASFIASDRFAHGEDYAVAMNEARDLCLRTFDDPMWILDANKLYEDKSEAVKAVVHQAGIDFDIAKGESDMALYRVMLNATRAVIATLRSPSGVTAVECLVQDAAASSL